MTGDGLKQLTRPQLLSRAADVGIRNPATLTKSDLIAAIRNAPAEAAREAAGATPNTPPTSEAASAANSPSPESGSARGGQSSDSRKSANTDEELKAQGAAPSTPAAHDATSYEASPTSEAQRNRGAKSIARPQTGPPSSKTAGGWFGRARTLVARVVEQGLHMPEAANLLRGSSPPPPDAPPPLPTVTLAEIYAAQGHHNKALQVLEDVLEHNPDHEEARALQAQIKSGAAALPTEHAVAAAEEEAAVTPRVTSASTASTTQKEATQKEAAEEEAAVTPRVTSASTALVAEVEATEDEAPVNPRVASAPTAATAADEAAEEEAAVTPRLASAPPSPRSEDAKPTPPGTQRDHHRVNDVVCLATDPETLFVYWEVRPLTYARARWEDPSGRLVLRIVNVHAVIEGAEIVGEERAIDIDELAGERFVNGLPSGAEIRVCVGWLGALGFKPLAVAAGLTMPRNYESSQDAVHQADQRLAASWRARPKPLFQTTPHTADRLRELQQDPNTVVRHSEMQQLRAGKELFHSGASELFSIAGNDARSSGGASDLFGGASDLGRKLNR